jgi:TfoX/Sxy family transcriptional regulator of competence genes
MGGRRDVVEKRMFGGLTFMVAGNMCCGVHSDDLILRLDHETVVGDLNSHARAWDFMKRPMNRIFVVGPHGCGSQKAVDRWVEMALDHALTLSIKR